MNILGKELSEKTASLIKEITQCLSKPVEYRFTDPSKTSSYGQCDAWQPDTYYIYCKESLLSAALAITLPNLRVGHLPVFLEPLICFQLTLLFFGARSILISLLLRWIIRAPVSYFLQPLLLEVNPCTAVEARHHRGIFFARTPQVIIHSFRWLHSRIGKTHSASLLILQAPGVVAWSRSLISWILFSSTNIPPQISLYLGLSPPHSQQSSQSKPTITGPANRHHSRVYSGQICPHRLPHCPA